MAETKLNSFFDAVSRTLQDDSGPAGRDRVCTLLADALKDPAFVAACFPEGETERRRTLFHDPVTDVHVLAHLQASGPAGKPHDHGTSWAIYGTAVGITDIEEWAVAGEETNPSLSVDKAYRLAPGQAAVFNEGTLHSTHHPVPGTKVVRITGTDLDALPRRRFDRPAQAAE